MPAHKVHGLKHHPLYNTWRNMRRRCENITDGDYPGWGGRGIAICDEWCDDLVAFVDYVEAVLGPRPSLSHSIDRIDNNDDYRPGNLRWATPTEQRHNQRRYPVGVSGYAGVKSYYRRWVARYKGAYLGTFAMPEDAARAYDAAAWAHLGERAHLNFPRVKAA